MMETIITLNKQMLSIEQKDLGKIPKLSVNKGDRIGFIGKNGAGKTTFIKQLIDQSLAGQFHLDKADIAYFEQEILEHQNNALSGGQKNLERLKAVFLSGKSLLVLDEPTNHLDEENVAWLILQIKKFKGTIIIISHNRQFLDDVTDVTWRLADQELKIYRGNYTAFSQQYAEEQARLHKKFALQEKEKKKVREELTRLQNWSASAHAQSTKQEFFKEFYREKARKMDKQRKSAEKRLQQELTKNGVSRPKETKEVAIDFITHAPKTGSLMIGEKISKSYENKVILDQCQFTVKFGEHLAITGPNGSGKTTLLKIMMNNIDYQGDLWVSPAADIGYLSQNIFDLEGEWTIQYFVSHYINDTHLHKEAFLLFIQLGFDSVQWHQKIETLSMGERLKLKLLKQMIQGKNVLIFDEPTNHLDLDSREALESVLVQYKGTLIIVSHDSYLIKKVTDRTLSIKDLNEETEKVIINKDSAENNKKKDYMRLQLQKDQLISRLSKLNPNSKEYQEADGLFKQTLKELQALNQI